MSEEGREVFLLVLLGITVALGVLVIHYFFQKDSGAPSTGPGISGTLPEWSERDISSVRQTMKDMMQKSNYRIPDNILDEITDCCVTEFQWRLNFVTVMEALDEVENGGKMSILMSNIYRDCVIKVYAKHAAELDCSNFCIHPQALRDEPSDIVGPLNECFDFCGLD